MFLRELFSVKLFFSNFFFEEVLLSCFTEKFFNYRKSLGFRQRKRGYLQFLLIRSRGNPE